MLSPIHARIAIERYKEEVCIMISNLEKTRQQGLAHPEDSLVKEVLTRTISILYDIGSDPVKKLLTCNMDNGYGFTIE